jgi:hypothetical protein
MPIINVTTLQDILGGTAPTDAIFTAYMMRSGTRAVRVQDDEVIFPAQVNVKFVGGVPEEQIELETPPADCYWSIRIKGPERVLLRANVILPIGEGPFDFDELIEVDPETSLPDAGTALADAFLEAVQSATVGATGPTGPAADTGDITFDGVKIIGAGDASGDGNGYGTMELVPDGDRYESDQYLIIDPTAPNHIHIRAGGEQDGSQADLILGAENTNVIVSDNNGTVGITSSTSGELLILNEATEPSLGVVTYYLATLPSIGDTVNVEGTEYTVTEIDYSTEVDGQQIIYCDDLIFAPQTLYLFVGQPNSAGWSFNSSGVFSGPAEGLVRTYGLLGTDEGPLALIGPSGVVIDGDGGEFLNGLDSENQIATIGDIGIETSFEVVGGAFGAEPTFDGDPLFTGSYIRMSSNLVHFEIQVDFDNITNFGTGQYYIDLPFPAKHAYQLTNGCLHDISTGRDYPITGHVVAGESRLRLQSMDVAGQTTFNIPFTATDPVTLDVADNFHIAGVYIADTEAP